MRAAARGLLLLMLLDRTAGTVAAQVTRATVGGQAGYSRSDLGGPDAQQLRPREGALTGVFLAAPLNRLVTLRPELLFALKGGRATATLVNGGTAPFEIELAYIEVPVLARVVLPTGRVRPVLFGGPAPSFQIGCDVALILPQQPIRATCGEANFAIFRDFDFGVTAGGGVEVGWPLSALSLEGRYTVGVRSILDGADVRNREFGLLLALTF